MIRELALFAGAGGGLLASELIGIDTRCAVEIDPYARSVLLARQRDGMLGRFPIWDDVKTFDGRPWRGSIELVSGGFPCQDISAAGKGGGITAERSGLFFEMLRIIKEVRPKFVFAENSPNLRTRGLVTVVKEFNRLGYDVRWCVLGAWQVGGPHKRNRMWIFAYLPDTDGKKLWDEHGRGERPKGKTSPEFVDNGSAWNVADADGKGELRESGTNSKGRRRTSDGRKKTDAAKRCSWWAIEPNVGRVAHGVAARMDRLKTLGNGQVPAVACLAWEILTRGILNDGP